MLIHLRIFVVVCTSATTTSADVAAFDFIFLTFEVFSLLVSFHFHSFRCLSIVSFSSSSLGTSGTSQQQHETYGVNTTRLQQTPNKTQRRQPIAIEMERYDE